MTKAEINKKTEQLKNILSDLKSLPTELTWKDKQEGKTQQYPYIKEWMWGTVGYDAEYVMMIFLDKDCEGIRIIQGC